MTDSPTFTNEGINRMFAQVFEIWVKPEIIRRQEAGLIPRPFHVHMAQVVFFPQGGLEVRLNQEAKATAQMRLKPGKRNVGDRIKLSDIEDIEILELPEDDIDCGHITVLSIGDRQLITWNGRYNTGTIEKLLTNADEFLATAEDALRAHRWRAFTENLFSAVELIAKSDMISFSDPLLQKAKSHRTVASTFNRRRKLGGVDSAHVDLLNELYTLRKAARYSTKPFPLEPAAAERMLATARDLRCSVEKSRPRRKLTG
jgi:hypothetical protein